MVSIDPQKIPARLMNIAHQFLIEKNQDPAVLWHHCGVPAECIYDELSLVPLESFLKSIQLIKKYNNNEPTSLIVRRLFPLTFMGKFGTALLAAPNIEKGLDLIHKYVEHFSPLSIAKIKDKSKDIFFQFKGCEIYSEFEQCMTEVFLMKIQDYILLCNGSYQGTQLNFKSKKQGIDTQEWINKNVKFNQPQNCLFINKNILSAPSPTADLNLYNISIRRLEAYKNNKSTAPSTCQKVKIVIQSHIASGVKPSLMQLARELHLSERNLSRKLKEEEQTFQKILDECIAKKAQFLLLNNRTVKQVSYDLGFNTVEGLNKTFYRYYGMSPKQYKDEIQYLLAFYNPGQ